MGRENKPPSYQWYPRDFRAEPAVDAMTFDQRGRYQWALDASWLTESYGVAPEDSWRSWMHYTPEEWAEVRHVFAPCFRIGHDGSWTQKRMTCEREKQLRRHAQASEGGRATQEKARTSRAQLVENGSIAPTLAFASAFASASESQNPRTSCVEPRAEDSSPVVLHLPLKNGDGFPITQGQIARWERTFPLVLVEDTLREQYVWLEANPTKRKTPSGMLRFVTGWLKREQQAAVNGR